MVHFSITQGNGVVPSVCVTAALTPSVAIPGSSVVITCTVTYDIDVSVNVSILHEANGILHEYSPLYDGILSVNAIDVYYINLANISTGKNDGIYTCSVFVPGFSKRIENSVSLEIISLPFTSSIIQTSSQNSAITMLSSSFTDPITTIATFTPSIIIATGASTSSLDRALIIVLAIGLTLILLALLCIGITFFVLIRQYRSSTKHQNMHSSRLQNQTKIASDSDYITDLSFT